MEYHISHVLNYALSHENIRDTIIDSISIKDLQAQSCDLLQIYREYPDIFAKLIALDIDNNLFENYTRDSANNILKQGDVTFLTIARKHGLKPTIFYNNWYSDVESIKYFNKNPHIFDILFIIMSEITETYYKKNILNTVINGLLLKIKKLEGFDESRYTFSDRNIRFVQPYMARVRANKQIAYIRLLLRLGHTVRDFDEKFHDVIWKKPELLPKKVIMELSRMGCTFENVQECATNDLIRAAWRRKQKKSFRQYVKIFGSIKKIDRSLISDVLKSGDEPYNHARSIFAPNMFTDYVKCQIVRILCNIALIIYLKKEIIVPNVFKRQYVPAAPKRL